MALPRVPEAQAVETLKPAAMNEVRMVHLNSRSSLWLSLRLFLWAMGNRSKPLHILLVTGSRRRIEELRGCLVPHAKPGEEAWRFPEEGQP